MNDAHRVSDWIEQAIRLEFQDHTAVRRLIEPALDIAKQLGNATLEARCLCELAWCEITAGNIETGTQTALKALTLARDHHAPAVECRAMTMISMALVTAGSHYDGLHILERQQSLAIELGDVEQLARAMSDIAVIYVYQSDYQRGFEILSRAHDLIEPYAEASASYLYVLVNLSMAYRTIQEPDKSMKSYHHLLDVIAGKNYYIWEGLARLGIGVNFLMMGDIDSAAREFALAHDLTLKTAHPVIHIQSNTASAMIEQAKGRNAEAIPYLKKALEVCRTYHQDEYVLHLLRALKDIQTAIGDAEAALSTYQQIDDFITNTLQGQMEMRQSIVRAVNEIERAWAQAKAERERAERLQHDIARQAENEKQHLLSQRLKLEAEYQAELLQRKEAIILRLSHEIRNPLAVVLASNELIERYHARMTAEQITKHTGQINQQVTRMTDLLKEILTALTLDQPPDL